MLKRLKWFNVVTLVLSVGFIYGSGYLVGLDMGYEGLPPSADHLQILIGAIGLWFGWSGFSASNTSISDNGLRSDEGKFAEITSAFSYPIAGIFGCCIAALGIVHETAYQALDWLASVFWAGFTVSAGYSVLHLIRYGFHRVVKDDSLVLIDGLLKYPGERVYLNPFYRYRIRRIDNPVPVYIEEVKVACKDGIFPVAIETTVMVDVDHNRANHVRSADPEQIKKDAALRVSRLLQAWAQERTVGELLQLLQGSKKGSGLVTPVRLDSLYGCWNGTGILHVSNKTKEGVAADAAA